MLSSLKQLLDYYIIELADLDRALRPGSGSALPPEKLRRRKQQVEAIIDKLEAAYALVAAYKEML